LGLNFSGWASGLPKRGTRVANLFWPYSQTPKIFFNENGLLMCLKTLFRNQTKNMLCFSIKGYLINFSVSHHFLLSFRKNCNKYVTEISWLSHLLRPFPAMFNLHGTIAFYNKNGTGTMATFNTDTFDSSHRQY
jgi:hypothetical protein